MPSHIYLPSCVVMFEEKDDEIRKVHTVCVAAAVLVACTPGEKMHPVYVSELCVLLPKYYMCAFCIHIFCVYG